MELAGSMFILIGKAILWLWLLVGIGVVVWWVWFRKMAYVKAKAEIFSFVKSYKMRCTESNRFVVTVPELQNIFREYETEIIVGVWLELVKEHVIEQDLRDGEWCIR